MSWVECAFCLTNVHSDATFYTFYWYTSILTSTDHPDSLHGWLWLLEGGHDEVANRYTQGSSVWKNYSKKIFWFGSHELDLQALRRLLDMCLSYSRDGRSSFRNVNIYQSSFLNISAPNPQLRLLTCLIILCQWKLLPRCLCPLRIWWAPCPRSTNPSQNRSSTGEFLLVARSPWSTDCLQDKPAKWGLVERLLLLTQGGPQFRLLQHF